MLRDHRREVIARQRVRQSARCACASRDDRPPVIQNDVTQNPLATQKAAEHNCENHVVHSFFLRDSECSADSASRLASLGDSTRTGTINIASPTIALVTIALVSMRALHSLERRFYDYRARSVPFGPDDGTNPTFTVEGRARVGLPRAIMDLIRGPSC